MVLLRLIQGIGGSTLTSLSTTLIGDIYTGLDRTKALGYNAGILSIGTASYPVIGGLLSMVDWRYPFFMFLLAIPVGFGVMIISYPKVSTSRSMKKYVITSLELFKNRKLIVGFISGIAVFVFLYGAFITYLPFLLDKKFGANPFSRGVIISSMSIVTALVSSRLDFFIKGLGEGKTIRLGFIFYFISLLLTPFIPSLEPFIVVTLAFGMGHGIVFPALQNLVVSIASMENRGVVMTTYGSMVRIGQTIGPIIASFVSLFSLDAVFLSFAGIALIFAILSGVIAD